MNYTRPEAVLGGSALVAIQGVNKTSSPVALDIASPYDFTATKNAYEADE